MATNKYKLAAGLIVIIISTYATITLLFAGAGDTAPIEVWYLAVAGGFVFWFVGLTLVIIGATTN